MTLTAYQDHLMMFKGRVCHYVRITRLSTSVVKLANDKATEVRQVYLVRGVTGASGLSTCSMRCYSYEARWFFLGVW